MSLTLVASIFALLINQSFACDCGQAGYIDSPKLLEGRLSRFSWFVIIENTNCGAALIDDQHVATSAHCVAGLNAASLKVRLNDNSTKSVSSIWIDEKYNEDNGANDFSVLTLDSPINSQIKPICLRKPEFMPLPGMYLISPKSGANLESNPSPYDASMCSIPATKTHICIMNFNKKEKCPEGPFMANEVNSRYYLAGITSRCSSSENGDLYTDVSQYSEKIQELAPNGCWKNKMEFN